MRVSPVRIVALALAVGSVTFADAWGGRGESVAAYLIAVAIGVLVYLQAEHEVSATAYGTTLVGYALGCLLSLAAATALLVTFVGAPVDVAAWFVGVRLSFSWLGIGFTVLASYSVISAIAVNL